MGFLVGFIDKTLLSVQTQADGVLWNRDWPLITVQQNWSKEEKLSDSTVYSYFLSSYN